VEIDYFCNIIYQYFSVVQLVSSVFVGDVVEQPLEDTIKIVN